MGISLSAENSAPMLDCSLNEVSARCKLAAKGAGYSWGMAEEVARSVFWLLSRGLPALERLASLLDSIPLNESVSNYSPNSISANVHSNLDWLCPIASGCMVSDLLLDLSEQNELQFSDLRSPLLLVPFIADLADQSNVLIALQNNTESIATDGMFVRYSSEQLLLEDQVNRLNCKVLSKLNECGRYIAKPTEKSGGSERSVAAP